jgi:hypothetical protein
MAGWEQFGEREWRLLGDAPQAAAAAVALSSAGGGRREASALVSGWREAGRQLGGSPLIAELAVRMDPEYSDQQGGGGRDYGPPPTFDELLNEALTLCERAVATLAATAGPEEVDAYRRFVLYICERVADANNEQGVFGIGGDAMSRDEVSVLRLVARALGR